MKGENPVGHLGEMLVSYAAYSMPKDADVWPAISARLGVEGTPVGESIDQGGQSAPSSPRFRWASLALTVTVLAAVFVAASAYFGLRPGIVDEPAAAVLETVVEAQEADDFMSSYSDYKGIDFSGCVLLSKGDRVLLSKCYGMSDYEEGLPNTLQTVFPITGITQHFTAAAIMLLQEEGLLDVSDPIGKYLPEYPNGGSITIHHLLTHTSAIPDFWQLVEDPEETLASPFPVDDVIAWFRDKPLDFAPGERFSGSNSGYVLLSHLVEKLSGKSYEEFLKENIFQALNMANTAYDRPEDSSPGRAKGYNPDLTPTQPLDMTSFHGAGALASTIGDLYLWSRELSKGGLLTRDSIGKMFTPYVELPNYEGLEWGYGSFIIRDTITPSVTHAGRIPGYEAIMRIHEDADVVVIMLGNTTDLGTPNTEILGTALLLANIATDY